MGYPTVAEKSREIRDMYYWAYLMAIGREKKASLFKCEYCGMKFVGDEYECCSKCGAPMK